MVTVPLGSEAYKRQYDGAPEVKLVNRFIERSPTNLREKSSLIARPGTNFLVNTPPDTGAGLNRGNWSKTGLFDGDLFVTCGHNFYRYDTAGLLTHITGLVNGAGFPVIAWQKGIGYERLFISDGLLLQYYAGGTHATGTLSGTFDGSQVVEIGGVYYGWNAAVDTNAPDGSAAHPWLANPGTDPATALANLINFDGVRGTDFSTALGGPNPNFSATAQGGPPATSVLITATSPYAAGNAITTTIHSGTGLAWSATTLTGGNVHALQGVAVPDGVGIRSLTALSSYVLASVANSQEFFFVQPGAVVIDPLDFASKESNPDNITDMVTIGDQAIICGEGSTENWYATGDLNAPFAPVEGRVYRRGCLAGTAVAVKDSLCIVGDDLVVYAIGYSSGDTAAYGVNRISTHGIEERIRTQIRAEQGLP